MNIPKHKKPILGKNDLKSRYPSIAAELDEERSGISAEEITYGARMKLWWFCNTGNHSYPASPNTRVSTNSGCTYCSNRAVLNGLNDLTTLRPELVEEWDFTLNEIEPSEIQGNSHRKVWWKCKEQPHSYLQSPNQKSGCPYCSGRKVLQGFNDLLSVNPEIATQWDCELNGELLPNAISHGSSKKVWWICSKGHQWQASPKQRKSRGCKNCISKVSKAEIEISEKLRKLGFEVITSSRGFLDGKEIDVFLPEYNVGIEYNGVWWHCEESGTPRHSHLEKWKLAKKNKIDLVFLDEDIYIKNSLWVDQFCAILLEEKLVSKLNFEEFIENGSLEELYLSRKGFTPKEFSEPSAKKLFLKNLEKVPSDFKPSVFDKIATIWNAGYTRFELGD